MSLLIEYNELLRKYNKIQKKVIPKLELDSKPAQSEKYPRTKIKSYEDKVNTIFHNGKIPKEGSDCICLSMISIDSFLKQGKDYCPQMFLEECKYKVI